MNNVFPDAIPMKSYKVDLAIVGQEPEEMDQVSVLIVSKFKVDSYPMAFVLYARKIKFLLQENVHVRLEKLLAMELV